MAGSFGTINGVAIPGFARPQRRRLARHHLPGAGQRHRARGRPAERRQAGGRRHLFAGERPAGRQHRALPADGGALDTTFQAGYGADSWITSVEIDYSGRIVAGGNFTWFNGQRSAWSACSTGAIDNAFQGSADGMVKSLAIEVSQPGPGGRRLRPALRPEPGQRRPAQSRRQLRHLLERRNRWPGRVDRRRHLRQHC